MFSANMDLTNVILRRHCVDLWQY